MKKLLVANRGEIAIRVMRAATELGLRTVAVYTWEDRFALHRFKADEAYLLGPENGGEPVKGYLNIENLLAIAINEECDAIHPGYGFLSENPELARACEKNGVTFVGPTAKLLEMFGDKTTAKKLAKKADVPTLPGSEGALSKPSEIKAAAKKIGFPLIIKASFGGGGRGMRVVKKPDELAGKLEEAQREAGAAFGRAEVFLERYVARAKHIEVQILGDAHGNLVHLWERDCSVQRRHQKVVEVAPGIELPQKLRNQICDAAKRLCATANYRNAGTVEFLFDLDRKEFYFIEVNPRIQVEHTVTEQITGIDLVRSQLLVAQGFKLHESPLSIPEQDKIETRGVAIQCRITTEDPENNFIPDYGRLATYRSAAGFGIRLDAGSAYGGAVITPFFDSLLVKVTSLGTDLSEAAKRMNRALREFRVRGVKTNIQFLENVILHPTFLSGGATTTFIDSTPELFEFTARRDRATKILKYLGDVIINSRPDVKGKVDPTRHLPSPRIPAFPKNEAPPPGT
ncbi:MAG: ATP-grasp domain-containing protein, partial [Anaerolineae bacterium]|nr:ATP-grasp domain-containing protein [Phycisphaerae bacterium]